MLPQCKLHVCLRNNAKVFHRVVAHIQDSVLFQQKEQIHLLAHRFQVLLFYREPFFQVLDNFIEGQMIPSELARISIHVNSQLLPTYALNDILIAHPCPAAISRFSFQ